MPAKATGTELDKHLSDIRKQRQVVDKARDAVSSAQKTLATEESKLDVLDRQLQRMISVATDPKE